MIFLKIKAAFLKSFQSFSIFLFTFTMEKYNYRFYMKSNQNQNNQKIVCFCLLNAFFILHSPSSFIISSSTDWWLMKSHNHSTSMCSTDIWPPFHLLRKPRRHYWCLSLVLRPVDRDLCLWKVYSFSFSWALLIFHDHFDLVSLDQSNLSQLMESSRLPYLLLYFRWN